MKPTPEHYLAAIAKIEKFSPAPRVLGQAMAFLRDPDANLSEITDLIKTDSALTTDVLRGANSAYYGMGERVSSLDRAVQRIGFKECIRLLNLSVAHTLAAQRLTCYGITAEDFWAESLFNGLFMETLARHIGAIDPGTAHTAGLLRYVGRLAINRCLLDLGELQQWDRRTWLPVWEVEHIGFSQTFAAARLLRAWQFSEDIVRAIEWQEDPANGEQTDDLLAALHFTAMVLPQGMGLSFAELPGDRTKMNVVETRFVVAYELTTEATLEVLKKTRVRFSEVISKLY
ncbi:MAG TPA: HDOD domain-containing protein [Opitutaceae bacterium]|nr:HDOD domain-containing protein [Opitutaceae bacterium]